MMNTMSYCINTREGEKACFDLESMEFMVTVLKAGRDCTIIDNVNGNLYMVQAETAKAAVTAYVDWMFGMVNVWAADEDEFGCYNKTEEECWASLCCDISEKRDGYEIVVES